MAIHIRDRETDALVRQLAERRGVGITESIKAAVAKDLLADEPSFREKLNARRARLAALRHPPVDGFTDKEFSDWINGEYDY